MQTVTIALSLFLPRAELERQQPVGETSVSKSCNWLPLLSGRNVDFFPLKS